MHPDLDISPIASGLWQGARPPAGDVLRREGFDAVVFCEREYQPSSRDFPGLVIIHAPNDDAPVIADVQWRDANRAAMQAASIVARGGKVLCACHAGLNRSGLVSALVIRALTGLSGADAVRIVKAARFRALGNPAFVKMLSALPARGSAALIGRGQARYG